MTIIKLINIFLLTVFLAQAAFCADQDSLLYKQALENYEKAKKLRKEGHHLQARTLYQEALLTFAKLNKNEDKSNVYNELGISYYTTGEYEPAMLNFRYLLQETQKTGNKEDKYYAFLNMGCVYFDLGVYEKAMELFNQALEIAGKEKTEERASVLNLIANVFYAWQNYDAALEIYKEALEINQDQDNKIGLADNYNNIGNIYHDLDSLNEAYDWYLLSYDIEKKLENNPGLAKSLNNMASVSVKKGEIEIALNLHKQAEEINISLQDFPNLAWTYNMIGKLYRNIQETDSALYYFHKAEKTLETIGHKELLMDIYGSLAEIYDSLGSKKQAYEYFSLHLLFKDSVYNENAANQIELLKIKYQTEKKLIEIETVELENKKLESEQQIRIANHQRTSRIANMLLLILGLFLLFSVVILFKYIKNRRLNKVLVLSRNEIIQQKEEILAQRDEIAAQRNNILEQKEIVTIQKEHIRKQNENIKQSIEYAGKIQQTLLDGFRIDLPHFILFKPRDFVSGDFYWLYSANDKTIIAAADCTGHGVPGASMSVLGITYLKDIVIKNGVFEPSIILNQLREKIIETLRQKSEGSKSRDGMDMAIVCIDKKNQTLSYAGANNPVYIVPENSELFVNLNPGLNAIELSEKGKTLFELKPDKMPIGVFEEQEKSFTYQKLKISMKEEIFLFSDGYADQFGGPTEFGKKLKYKPFKKILMQNTDKDLKIQKKEIDRALSEWMKGDSNRTKSFEQVDDILIIGIKTG